MWGFITCLNDILIPHFKSVFELSYLQAALVQFTFFSAYFLMALPSGWILARIGYQKTMGLGLLVAGFGAFIFVPAAQMVSYHVFLFALLTLATGMTLLQVSANPYVNNIGPAATAASRLNLTQAFNSLGTTVAPLIGGILIFASTGERSEISAVVLPYVGLGLMLIVLAVFVNFYRLPELPAAASDGSQGILQVLKVRHTVLGAVAIFVYVGAEVSIGSFLVDYLGEPGVAGMEHAEAAKYVAYYWGGAMLGRFIGAGLLQRIPAGTLLGCFAAVAGALTLTSSLTSGTTAMISILAVGLFNSVMFPSIFSLGIAKLGGLSAAGSSLLIMAVVGGALIPLAMGGLADAVGLAGAFMLPAVCYIYILYYAFVGSRPQK